MLLLAAYFPLPVAGWRQFTSWDTRQWCLQVEAPRWPFAYSKTSIANIPAGGPPWELKGRTASNAQVAGHSCALRGARSMCHICDTIACGVDSTATCEYQLQGLDYPNLPINAPVVTDGPFAVGGAVTHRHDFGRAARVCVMLSGGACATGNKAGGDYSACALRCWGASYAPPVPDATGWVYPADVGLPQGRVDTVAGSASEPADYVDAPAGADARFNNPQGVAVDRLGNVYVADTGNHAIRLVTPAGAVSTFAGGGGGSGQAGYADGPAATALFSGPVGIAVYMSCVGAACTPVLIVADTGNHRIRRIRGGLVNTVAGGGNTTAAETEQAPSGLADGPGVLALFDTPMGVAVDDAGNIYVADTRNNVLRHIDRLGVVRTLAGTVGPAPRELPGCAPPCLQGVSGYADGALATAQFHSPYSVALGPGSPYTLLVADGNRVRLVMREGQVPFAAAATAGGTGFSRSASAAQIAAWDVVVTLAGSLGSGQLDGHGANATLDTPRGVTMTPDGRVYVADALRCRIRTLTSARLKAQPITCGARGVDLVRPAGCSMYDDAPPDAVGRMVTPVLGGINYNYNISASGASMISAADGSALDGRRLPACLGSPPQAAGDEAGGAAAGATLSRRFTMDEDTGQGTTLLVACPAGCAADAGALSAGVLGGSGGVYADASSVCAAAVHAGVVASATGGVVVLTWGTGYGPNAGDPAHAGALTGSIAHGIASTAPATPPTRTFTLTAVAAPDVVTEVATAAGGPAADLDTACGHADGQPPLAARFNGPAAVAAALGVPALSNSSLARLFIADAHNNAIRAMGAVCGQACENGGRCVGPEACECAPGWAGHDCSAPVCAAGLCGPRTLCTGPATCTCVPGYTGAGCTVPQCVQTCAHGGTCAAPDTCLCAAGWFDANCTTPVCSQTCGNGGNCTAPSVCSCPAMWAGADCRTPVCTQTCVNGGSCTAPGTCTCTPGWSGHDCSAPVCSQGFLVASPAPGYAAPTPLRRLHWLQFTPCARAAWCAATNEFDCAQYARVSVDTPLPPLRNVSGKGEAQPVCFAIELALAARTPFQYEDETGSVTSYARYTAPVPYGWGPTPTSHPWSSPVAAPADRLVALVAYANVTQGVYACANGGNCTAPDTCHCAPGWVGFDCRTPVCRQGFYFPADTYPVMADARFPGQGRYKGSARTLTVWENPVTPGAKFTGYIHDHPNFHSRDADMNLALGLPGTHVQQPGMESNAIEGWRRDGWWTRVPGTEWEWGSFRSTFNRTCGSRSAPSNSVDLRSGATRVPVDDTFLAFRARVTYNDTMVTAAGRWVQAPAGTDAGADGSGECVDRVLLGCFNRGVCTAPDTCECAPGWEGHDCSLPVCAATVTSVADAPEVPGTLLRADGVNVGTAAGPPPLPGDTRPQFRRCPNQGNCTHPNVCTCEKGWTGEDCRTPLCAQECFHGGNCTAPDTCTCAQWPTSVVDARVVPLFRKPGGEPQSTGWTGLDCNTPICVQAEAWILNDDSGNRPVELARAVRNDGRTFQGGCPGGGDFIPPDDQRTRVSDSLCGVTLWYQGDYAQSWANDLDVSYRSPGRVVRVNDPHYVRAAEADTFLQGAVVNGEGIYACYNSGACVAPDTCACNDGWEGYDCNVPQCRHVNYYRQEVSCLHGGVCGGLDTCTCALQPSLLWQMHEDMPTDAMTGWTAPDCSMALCTQGFFDADCIEVPPGAGGVASGGVGCYRCANGGNCTAPDLCTCPDAWTGYDCRTPVCVQHATAATIVQLDTLDEAHIDDFERDPCGSGVFEEYQGAFYPRGNCSRPNTCTCTCFTRAFRDASGALNDKPWTDPLGRPLKIGFTFGTAECIEGFEGNRNEDGTFSSCHLRIYVPTWIERNSLALVAVTVCSAFVLVVLYLLVRRKLRQRYLLIKAARRRSRRFSEQGSEQGDDDEGGAAGGGGGADAGGKGRRGGKRGKED
jgi:hypothetical protein